MGLSLVEIILLKSIDKDYIVSKVRDNKFSKFYFSQIRSITTAPFKVAV